jgi:hypothetical protein
MEIGAPMAAMYLLGNPDCYTSHEFRSFYWKGYVNFVVDEWNSYMLTFDPEEQIGLSDEMEQTETTDVGVARTDKENKEVKAIVKQDTDDTVHVKRSKNSIVGKTGTDDYRWRSVEHEQLCLYEWIQCSIKHYEKGSRAGWKDLQFFNYKREHPMHASHTVVCDLNRRKYVIPNFIGPPLPRKDSSNREQYCQTMLTFFCPWCTGIDLKAVDESWEKAFERYAFTERQRELMGNFNVRYECYDARDDFNAHLRSSGKSENKETDCKDNRETFEDPEHMEDCLLDGEEEVLDLKTGPRTATMQKVNELTKKDLALAGWTI